jgi:hypothetical protein
VEDTNADRKRVGIEKQLADVTKQLAESQQHAVGLETTLAERDAELRDSDAAQIQLEFAKSEYELYRGENERLKTQVADGIEKQRKLQQELVTVMEAYARRRRKPKKRGKGPRFSGHLGVEEDDEDEDDDDDDVMVVPWAL